MIVLLASLNKYSDAQPLWAEARKFATLNESYLIVDEKIYMNFILRKIHFVRIGGVEIII